MTLLLPLCLGLLGAAPTEAGVGASIAPGRTAVVVTLERGSLPEPEAMRGWFLAGGEPRRVLAVEKGPAEVVVVRDPAVQPALERLAGAFLDRAIIRARGHAPIDPEPLDAKEWDPQILRLGEEAFIEVGRTFCSARQVTDSEIHAARNRLRRACTLGEGARLRFVSPMAAPVSRTAAPMGVLMQSPSFLPGPRGFLDFVEKIPRLDFSLRAADAVWATAHELHAGARRRAVVTWVDGRARDKSLHTAAALADLLERLQVPHFVWPFGPGPPSGSLGGPLAAAAAGSSEGTSLEAFENGCAEVRSALAAQRVVWIEGDHPPAAIRLGPRAEGLRLAGSLPPTAEEPPLQVAGGRP